MISRRGCGHPLAAQAVGQRRWSSHERLDPVATLLPRRRQHAAQRGEVLRSERNAPEISRRGFIVGRSRSAWLFAQGTPASCRGRIVSVLKSRNRNARFWPVAWVPARCRRERRHAPRPVRMPSLPTHPSGFARTSTSRSLDEH